MFGCSDLTCPKAAMFQSHSLLQISGWWSELSSSSLPISRKQKYDKLFPFFIGSQIARINLHMFFLVFPVEFFVAVSCWGGCRKRRKSSSTRWSRKKPRKQSHRTGCDEGQVAAKGELPVLEPCWKYGKPPFVSWVLGIYLKIIW